MNITVENSPIMVYNGVTHCLKSEAASLNLPETLLYIISILLEKRIVL
jgi:hypothetical protein